MRQSIVPVLLLAAVAFSSSNVLPMMSTNQLESEIAIVGQQNDNIFSSRFNPRESQKDFYTLPFGSPQRNTLWRQIEKFNKNHNRAEEIINDIVDNDDNYDGEGFRKEQWHNYPRQLDRLQKFLFATHKTGKRTPETDDLDNLEGTDSMVSSDKNDDTSTNEYFLDSDGRHNIYDAVVAATNPLLILKIHLACLNKGIKQSYTKDDGLFQVEPKILSENSIEDERFSNEINPGTKVKREDELSSDAEISENTLGSKKSKRLFSLWSRLQTLSHKGHELPHRRHLAFYGFPEEESGGSSGTLTAPQTRATFVRPPGSPLRWG